VVSPPPWRGDPSPPRGGAQGASTASYMAAARLAQQMQMLGHRIAKCVPDKGSLRA
jgi:hypothetical protein